jgi:hypothetical protein
MAKAGRTDIEQYLPKTNLRRISFHELQRFVSAREQPTFHDMTLTASRLSHCAIFACQSHR